MEYPYRIQQSINELKAGRVNHITNLIKEVARKKGKVNIQQISVRRELIWGVSDLFEAGVDYRNWRFNTVVKGFSASYYEIWYPIERDVYFLSKAYFHLYRRSEIDYVPEEKEYLGLHCDANEPDDAAHAKFKQSPHLHFFFAEQPIPHSHIALNNGNLEEILSSVDALQLAMQQAVIMINDQILTPLAGYYK